MLDRAVALLLESGEESSGDVVSAVCPIAIGLISHHTYYFDGFGLSTPSPFSVAVAMRPTKRLDVAVEGCDPLADVITRVVESVLALDQSGQQFQVAVVTNAPWLLVDEIVGAVAAGIGKARGSISLIREESHPQVTDMARVVELVLDRPFGVHPLLSALNGGNDQSILIDSQSHKWIHLPRASNWGLLSIGDSIDRIRPSISGGQEIADRAPELLRSKGFSSSVQSLRDLEHRDLDKAIGLLPADFEPVVRHLVGENRRVQRVAAALRSEDAQLIGGLMLVSESSRKRLDPDDGAEYQSAFQLAESVEGLYGARMVGSERGSALLFLGHGSAVDNYLQTALVKLERALGPEVARADLLS